MNYNRDVDNSAKLDQLIEGQYSLLQAARKMELKIDQILTQTASKDSKPKKGTTTSKR